MRPVSKIFKCQYEFPEYLSIEGSALFIEKVKARCEAFGFEVYTKAKKNVKVQMIKVNRRIYPIMRDIEGYRGTLRDIEGH